MKSFFFLLFCLLNVAVFAEPIENDDSLAFARLTENIEHLEKIQTDLTHNTGETPSLRNELFMQLSNRARISEESSQILSEYFLQRRISPTDPLLEKKLVLVHSLLFLFYQVKRSTDMALFSQMKKEVSALKRALISPILKASQGPRYKNSSKMPSLVPREIPSDN